MTRCYEQVIGRSQVLKVLLGRATKARTATREIMLCEEITFCVEGKRMTYGAGDVLEVAERVSDELKRRGERILVWA
ncbi:MAG: hypothetical protein M1497_03455 [Nitrospirae bacterium]|nr:hypothetical protein [Nitrospirota bacterium]